MTEDRKALADISSTFRPTPAGPMQTVTEYGVYVDSSAVMGDGRHYGEEGLDNFIALVRRQWGEGKAVVLTGSHVFIPPPADAY